MTYLCKFQHGELAWVAQIERANVLTVHQSHQALHLYHERKASGRTTFNEGTVLPRKMVARMCPYQVRNKLEAPCLLSISIHSHRLLSEGLQTSKNQGKIPQLRKEYIQRQVT